MFLQTDPIPGGSANAYDYCNADPIDCYDLAGTWPHWVKKIAHVAARTASVVKHVALNVVAVPVYAVYYGNYQAARGINAVGGHLGPVGSNVAHSLSLFTVPSQELGLYGDEGIDRLKGESVGDEGQKGSIDPFHDWLPHSLSGPYIYLPGVHSNGSRDIAW